GVAHRREQRATDLIVGRDLEDAAAHGHRLQRATLPAIRDRDRAIQLDGIAGAPGGMQRTRERDAQPEIARLVAKSALECRDVGGHEGVSETVAWNDIAGAFCDSTHLEATARMQVSNVSPSDGANDAFLYWPACEKS